MRDARAASSDRPGAPARDGAATWLRSPCLGLCERAPAALFTIAGRDAARRRRRADRRRRRRAPDSRAPPATSGRDVERAVRRAARPTLRGARSRRPATSGRCGCWAGSAGSTRRASTTTARNGGYAGAAPGRSSWVPSGSIEEVTDVQAHGSRRGGVPDRPQVGGGRGAAGPAALPRLQRRRVGARHVQGPGPDGGATRSRSSRR